MWRLLSLLAIGVALAFAAARAQVPPPSEQPPVIIPGPQASSETDLPPTSGDPKAPYSPPAIVPVQPTDQSTSPGTKTPPAAPELKPASPDAAADPKAAKPKPPPRAKPPKPKLVEQADEPEPVIAEPGKPLAFRCFVRDVMVFYDRTHVRCYNKRGKINFFAVDTAQPITKTVLSKALSGMQNGKPVTITYAPGDDLNPANCGKENCRRLLDIRN